MQLVILKSNSKSLVFLVTTFQAHFWFPVVSFMRVSCHFIDNQTVVLTLIRTQLAKKYIKLAKFTKISSKLEISQIYYQGLSHFFLRFEFEKKGEGGT